MAEAQPNPTKAIALKLTALFLFTIMAALVKQVVQDVPPGQAVFFRASCSIPVLVIWLISRGELATGFRTEQPMLHVWRGVIGTIAMGLSFAGLGLLPLPEVTAIGYATPLFTVILAALMLGERVRMVRITAVVLGLVGVMIVIWPRLSLGSWAEGAAFGALCILAASILRALVQIQVRRMVRSESTSAIVFWFAMTATVASLFTVPFGWVWPSFGVLAMMIASGLIGGVAQILITSAFRYGAASMLAPFDYASLIFAAVIGYIIFGEIVTLTMAIGAGLVVAGGAIIIWRERQLGLERGKARQVTDPKG